MQSRSAVKSDVNDFERLSDEELVSRFLETTLHLNDTDRAEAVDVTHTTIGRWRAGYGQEGGWRRLHRATRRKLEDFIERSRTTQAQPREAGQAVPSAQPAPELGVSGSPDLHELTRQIDEVNALDADEWVKAWKIGEIAAAYRSRALAENTTALRIAEEAALERARAATMNGRAVLAESEAAASRAPDRRPRGRGSEAAPVLPGTPREERVKNSKRRRA